MIYSREQEKRQQQNKKYKYILFLNNTGFKGVEPHSVKNKPITFHSKVGTPSFHIWGFKQPQIENCIFYPMLGFGSWETEGGI